jgi:hypothetical protein
MKPGIRTGHEGPLYPVNERLSKMAKRPHQAATFVVGIPRVIRPTLVKNCLGISAKA